MKKVLTVWGVLAVGLFLSLALSKPFTKESNFDFDSAIKKEEGAMKVKKVSLYIDKEYDYKNKPEETLIDYILIEDYNNRKSLFEPTAFSDEYKTLSDFNENPIKKDDTYTSLTTAYLETKAQVINDSPSLLSREREVTKKSINDYYSKDKIININHKGTETNTYILKKGEKEAIPYEH